MAYSLPDLFTRKETVYDSVEADIRSMLTIFGCHEGGDITIIRKDNKYSVLFWVKAWDKLGFTLTEVIFDIDDQTETN